MRLETDRLILRPWTEDDAESLFHYAKDPAVGPIAGWPVHTSVENSRRIIHEVLSAEETYAVCLKEDNRAIGSVGLIPPMQSHTEAAANELEIGYWIGVPFWGQGLIPEAVRKLQEHAFRDLGCNAIWCGYYDGNEKSKRCQEKCGFTYHHTEKDKPCALMGDVRTEHFTRITKEEWFSMQKRPEVVLFIHGKGGNAEESEHYKPFFPNADVCGLDYQSEYPWDAKQEFTDKVMELSAKYHKITLVAVSIGAYFSMNAGIDRSIDRAFFISPIVHLEQLILDMIGWAGTNERELQEKKIIPTDFGDDLSWEYLQYVRKHPIRWEVPTEILYGSADHLQSIETIQAFVDNNPAALTVMEGGEHWFHTEEQLRFLDQWLLRKLSK